MRELVLPEFATLKASVLVEKGKVGAVIEVDPDIAYPAWQALLGKAVPLDKYWIEVIYQCAKLDVQAALIGTSIDPRISGKPVEIHIINRPKWALRYFPEGRGVDPATKGREAREHYKHVRGMIPFGPSALDVPPPVHKRRPWWKVW